MQIPPHRAVDAPSGPGVAPAGFPAHGSLPDVSPAAAVPVFANPALRLDPGLGLVVLEFRDAQGKVERTLPTARALAAYRTAARAAIAGPRGDAPPRQANSASTPVGDAPAADPAAITT